MEEEMGGRRLIFPGSFTKDKWAAVIRILSRLSLKGNAISINPSKIFANLFVNITLSYVIRLQQ
jgi:hypothetical protein